MFSRLFKTQVKNVLRYSYPFLAFALWCKLNPELIPGLLNGDMALVNYVVFTLAGAAFAGSLACLWLIMKQLGHYGQALWREHKRFWGVEQYRQERRSEVANIAERRNPASMPAQGAERTRWR